MNASKNFAVVGKHSSLPRQMNVCFLHDSEPGQHRLQVVLTGQVVIQSLGMGNGDEFSHHTLHDDFGTLVLCVFSHRDDLCVEFW